ncbi:efflux RND transporter periplasmic adaptor subunit [Tenacibaculum maritimum]|uniref:efflux RND transporter periplasmic adaptor subunit n=1 Tax=Tenacibaculum maritimum TaxID=107401 RepID=UPI001E5D0AFA|nr:efflux RND transporter periplasmic adaptor subunit [Tenacibaculum maritimum]MCD9563052.1 efflux RND transporter periplasmic adaptor subunit [Tenacibaculum maritimum]MCD9566762.1 efflux RND transporter periplasmic adaptor subunit [Tenacibaculum maritimum]MCD9577943.1 efflux RND transporter periplasmic adaptor subunit [Tenacibaculum maritimum]MCD9596848.1 efflux RND transporter periplasmic adaptor subunit [Tenacibaculum maritimum]MCD9614228.1 efflux RND transporter periplasmic adaptor subunit
MKKIIILAVTAIFIISCNLKGGDHSDHDHAAEERVPNSKKESKEEHNENELHLTKEQLIAAGIQSEEITKREIRNRVAVTGTIEVPPQSKATIYAPLEAFVHKTNLLPGDKVTKGQIIAVLQHPNFIELQYAYLEAINKRNVAQADYKRKKMLLENEIASKKSYQIVEGAYRSAQSLVDSYKEQLKLAGLSPDKIVTKGIQQYVEVKAPISGYVVENNLNKGMFLAANSEMMEIIDNDHMHAELNVFGTDITKIKKGDEFIFKPSGVDVEYKGAIQLISQKVNEKTKTVNVHGHFEDEENRLKSGMFINAEILLKGREVFTVPENALIEKGDEYFVFMAESKTEFIPLEVTIGNFDKGFVEVKAIQGDNFNIRVVTKGAHFLKGKLLQQSGGMEGHAH